MATYQLETLQLRASDHVAQIIISHRTHRVELTTRNLGLVLYVWLTHTDFGHMTVFRDLVILRKKLYFSCNASTKDFSHRYLPTKDSSVKKKKKIDNKTAYWSDTIIVMALFQRT